MFGCQALVLARDEAPRLPLLFKSVQCMNQAEHNDDLLAFYFLKVT